MTLSHTIASAPGKVLLTGGYLVLEQQFQGLVVGTSARFYTIITPSDEPGIQVRSPQFDGGNWHYTLTVQPDFQLTPSSGTSRNPFVEASLRFTLALVREKVGRSAFGVLSTDCIITILGDNDFYSQQAQLEKLGLDSSYGSLAGLPPFADTMTSLKDVHKTGLGSSAALTTSLVAALCAHFKAVDLDNQKDRTLVHNLAQFVHCFAQGKVGSGFDVSAAVWGSHRYRRFNPQVLASIMDQQVDGTLLLKHLSADSFGWDNEVAPFKLPPGFDLILADIDAGSHTPTLVGKVLAWRKANPTTANALWVELGSYNSKVEQVLRDLTTAEQKEPVLYKAVIEKCSRHKASEWASLPETNEVISKMVQLVHNFGHVRRLLREMSQLSEVPIEPIEQTQLLEACLEVEGTVIAGVPGAGGYDAIFCIVLSDKAKQQVRQVWQGWSALSVGPLLSKADSKGVTLVELADVPGLANSL
ncbi:Phosphomevalonate kinase [Phycomyces blakesleeanus]|uniref:Phosphomevalonate kinase n=1 Tax=Phycomyces blakesleeanus TaxID=4837 RepID=A0ABR3ANG1_PHYBL